MNHIKLNDILRLDNLDNVKIRFNLMFAQNWNPIEVFKNGDMSTMLDGHYWNFKKKSYKVGQLTVGLVKINRHDDLWLLFHAGRVTKDLNTVNGVGYEYIHASEFDRYVGRVIVQFKNNAQTMIRNAASVIDECYVAQILPDRFDNDVFPGYDKIMLSWDDLRRVLSKDNWKTALQNQKGIYLITDIANGKLYVGAACGEYMLLGRWRAYVESGHGGNVNLKPLPFDYIKQNFRYSILDIYKSTTDDRVIIERELWWKDLLQTRRFGYNAN